MAGALATLLVLWMGVPDDADVRSAVRRVYENERLQQEWPHRDPPPPLRTPPSGRAGDPNRSDDRAPEAHGRRAEVRETSRSSGDPSPVWKAVLWILVAAIGAWILVALVRELQARRRDAKAPAKPPAPATTRGGSGPAVPLTPAEALAAEGRYDEAIHALWLETLAVIGRGATLDPALTSREVLERVKLAPARREAVGGLVSAVEVSLFGGRPASEADWLACAERHRVAIAAGPTAA